MKNFDIMPNTNELYCQQKIPKESSNREVFGDRPQPHLRLNKRVETLDYARFFAAIIVVFYHYTANGISAGNIVSITHIPWLQNISKYGYLGVELFFMISGYVIFFSARHNSASRFAVSRAVRIYPSYVFAVLITSFFIWQWGSGFIVIDFQTMLANFSMVQFFLGYGNVDDVYWTLVYELIFYFAVLLVLLSPWRKSFETIIWYWPLAMCFAALLGLEYLPLLGNYFYYFAAGTLFAMFRTRPDWKIPALIVIMFLFCLNFTIDKSATLEIRDNVEYSGTVISLIITMFFLFFAIQNFNSVQNLKLPLSGLFGSMTYPVYLVHGNIGYILINQFATEDNKIVVYLLTFLFILALAFTMNKLIEVKGSQIWRKWISSTLGEMITFLQNLPDHLQTAIQPSVAQPGFAAHIKRRYHQSSSDPYAE